MNYKEKWNLAESSILEEIRAMKSSQIARILASNLPTLPAQRVFVLAKLMEETKKAGDDMEECLQFCQEIGFLTGNPNFGRFLDMVNSAKIFILLRCNEAATCV